MSDATPVASSRSGPHLLQVPASPDGTRTSFYNASQLCMSSPRPPTEREPFSFEPSLAAGNLVNYYGDFGGGVEFEADPRRRTEAQSTRSMQSAVKTRAPARPSPSRPEIVSSFHSGKEEPAASFTFDTYFLMDGAPNSAERPLCLH